MNPQDVDIAENLLRVKEEMQGAARQAGREGDEIGLLVVTKEKPAQVVKRLVELGVNRVGESYVQEATFKMELLSDYEIEWHMVGNIQSGKSAFVVSQFACVHSLDRLALAQDLNQAAENVGRILPVYLECNVSGEGSKHGWAAGDEGMWDQLARDLQPVMMMDHLTILGLMTMAPYHEDPEHSRPYFKKLSRLRDYLADKFPDHDLSGLSMGMSGDYRVAIEEGATIVRVGSAIVGPRG